LSDINNIPCAGKLPHEIVAPWVGRYKGGVIAATVDILPGQSKMRTPYIRGLDPIDLVDHFSVSNMVNQKNLHGDEDEKDEKDEEAEEADETDESGESGEVDATKAEEEDSDPYLDDEGEKAKEVDVVQERDMVPDENEIPEGQREGDLREEAGEAKEADSIGETMVDENEIPEDQDEGKEEHDQRRRPRKVELDKKEEVTEEKEEKEEEEKKSEKEEKEEEKEEEKPEFTPSQMKLIKKNVKEMTKLINSQIDDMQSERLPDEVGPRMPMFSFINSGMILTGKNLTTKSLIRTFMNHCDRKTIGPKVYLSRSAQQMEALRNPESGVVPSPNWEGFQFSLNCWRGFWSNCCSNCYDEDYGTKILHRILEKKTREDPLHIHIAILGNPMDYHAGEPMAEASIIRLSIPRASSLALVPASQRTSPGFLLSALKISPTPRLMAMLARIALPETPSLGSSPNMQRSSINTCYFYGEKERKHNCPFKCSFEDAIGLALCEKMLHECLYAQQFSPQNLSLDPGTFKSLDEAADRCQKEYIPTYRIIADIITSWKLIAQGHESYPSTNIHSFISPTVFVPIGMAFFKFLSSKPKAKSVAQKTYLNNVRATYEALMDTLFPGEETIQCEVGVREKRACSGFICVQIREEHASPYAKYIEKNGCIDTVHNDFDELTDTDSDVARDIDTSTATKGHLKQSKKKHKVSGRSIGSFSISTSTSPSTFVSHLRSLRYLPYSDRETSLWILSGLCSCLTHSHKRSSHLFECIIEAIPSLLSSHSIIHSQAGLSSKLAISFNMEHAKDRILHPREIDGVMDTIDHGKDPSIRDISSKITSPSKTQEVDGPNAHLSGLLRDFLGEFPPYDQKDGAIIPVQNNKDLGDETRERERCGIDGKMLRKEKKCLEDAKETAKQQDAEEIVKIEDQFDHQFASSSSTDTSRVLSQLHNQLGVAYEEEGLYQKAIESYHFALSLSPMFLVPVFNLANLYLHCEQMENAYNLLDQFVDIVPLFSPSFTPAVTRLWYNVLRAKEEKLITDDKSKHTTSSSSCIVSGGEESSAGKTNGNGAESDSKSSSTKLLSYLIESIPSSIPSLTLLFPSLSFSTSHERREESKLRKVWIHFSPKIDKLICNAVERIVFSPSSRAKLAATISRSSTQQSFPSHDSDGYQLPIVATHGGRYVSDSASSAGYSTTSLLHSLPVSLFYMSASFPLSSFFPPSSPLCSLNDNLTSVLQSINRISHSLLVNTFWIHQLLSFENTQKMFDVAKNGVNCLKSSHPKALVDIVSTKEDNGEMIDRGQNYSREGISHSKCDEEPWRDDMDLAIRESRVNANEDDRQRNKNSGSPGFALHSHYFSHFHTSNRLTDILLHPSFSASNSGSSVSSALASPTVPEYYSNLSTCVLLTLSRRIAVYKEGNETTTSDYVDSHTQKSAPSSAESSATSIPCYLDKVFANQHMLFSLNVFSKLLNHQVSPFSSFSLRVYSLLLSTLLEDTSEQERNEAMKFHRDFHSFPPNPQTSQPSSQTTPDSKRESCSIATNLELKHKFSYILLSLFTHLSYIFNLFAIAIEPPILSFLHSSCVDQCVLPSTLFLILCYILLSLFTHLSYIFNLFAIAIEPPIRMDPSKLVSLTTFPATKVPALSLLSSLFSKLLNHQVSPFSSFSLRVYSLLLSTLLEDTSEQERNEAMKFHRDFHSFPPNPQTSQPSSQTTPDSKRESCSIATNLELKHKFSYILLSLFTHLSYIFNLFAIAIEPPIRMDPSKLVSLTTFPATKVPALSLLSSFFLCGPMRASINPLSHPMLYSPQTKQPTRIDRTPLSHSQTKKEEGEEEGDDEKLGFGHHQVRGQRNSSSSDLSLAKQESAQSLPLLIDVPSPHPLSLSPIPSPSSSSPSYPLALQYLYSLLDEVDSQAARVCICVCLWKLGRYSEALSEAKRVLGWEVPRVDEEERWRKAKEENLAKRKEIMRVQRESFSTILKELYSSPRVNKVKQPNRKQNNSVSDLIILPSDSIPIMRCQNSITSPNIFLSSLPPLHGFPSHPPHPSIPSHVLLPLLLLTLHFSSVLCLFSHCSILLPITLLSVNTGGWREMLEKVGKVAFNEFNSTPEQTEVSFSSPSTSLGPPLSPLLPPEMCSPFKISEWEIVSICLVYDRVLP
ncbi:hypothetical protein ADUPG1_011193, partial [Aduncisulcus paluster]